MRKYTPEDQITLFWSHVNKDGSIPSHCPELGQCWEWTAGHNKGYGVARYKKETLSHRISWMIAHGDIPNDLFVLHKCDNPTCINPDHLFLGTHQDNNDDMRKKGRGKYPGKKFYERKLTEAQTFEIVERYLAGGIYQRELAAEYRVAQSVISERITAYKEKQNIKTTNDRPAPKMKIIIEFLKEHPEHMETKSRILADVICVSHTLINEAKRRILQNS